MPEIKIDIANKVAAQIGTAVIVCGNDDYKITFTFDNEWGAYQEKTARFRFINAEGKKEYIDVLFSGSTCAVPILSNIDTVSVGVYAGDLQTTTGADIKCQRSILCGQGTKHEAPDPDVYNQILEACSQKLGSNGGTVTGDYYKDGNVFIHEGNLEKIDPRVQGLLDAGQYINAGNIDDHVQGLLDAGQYINPNNLELIDGHTQMVDTATGNALNIESASAPLQSLKLYGKTTQDGTPTPTEPKELKSVGDSGSFMVNVYGKNLFDITTLTPRNSSQGGKVTFEGDIANITSSNQAWAICYAEKLKVEKDKSYTFSFEITNYSATTQTYITVRSEKGTEYGAFWFSENGKFEYSFTPTEDSLLIGVTSNGSGSYITNTFTMSKAQLEQSTVSTEYEKCNKQSLTMPYTLRSVPYIDSSEVNLTDEIDFTNALRTTKTIKVTLDGTETIQAHGGGMLYIPLYNIKVSHKFKGGCGLCDQLTNAFSATATGEVFNIGSEGIYIGKCSQYSTPEELKAHLTSNPMIFIVGLATPIETPLSETELNAYRQLMTNSGNTTILSEADAEATYYKLNGQALGSVHAQINKDYLKLQQAIIALGGSTL